VKPEKQFINWLQDPFGNYMARIVFLEKAKELSVNVDLVAELKVINPFDFFIEPNQEHYPFTYPAELRRELSPYLKPSARGRRLKELV
jgi:transglutaminase-like putative cysteine protease